MKNKNEIILKYLDDQLDQKELNEFLKQLDNDPLLSKEVEELRTSLNKLKLMNKEVKEESDNSYFTGIIPEFNRRREKKEKKFILLKPSFIYSVTVAASLLLFISIPFFNNIDDDDDLFIDDFSIEEIIGYYGIRFNDADDLTSVYFNNDENVIDNYFHENFQLNPEEINFYNYYLNGYFDFQDNDNELFDEIYTEMINTKLL